MEEQLTTNHNPGGRMEIAMVWIAGSTLAVNASALVFAVMIYHQALAIRKADLRSRIAIRLACREIEQDWNQKFHSCIHARFVLHRHVCVSVVSVRTSRGCFPIFRSEIVEACDIDLRTEDNRLVESKKGETVVLRYTLDSVTFEEQFVVA